MRQKGSGPRYHEKRLIIYIYELLGQDALLRFAKSKGVLPEIILQIKKETFLWKCGPLLH